MCAAHTGLAYVPLLPGVPAHAPPPRADLLRTFDAAGKMNELTCLLRGMIAANFGIAVYVGILQARRAGS